MIDKNVVTKEVESVIGQRETVKSHCWKEEFPQFELDVIIPQGFIDMSYCENSCPCWDNKDLQVMLWVDYEDIEMSKVRSSVKEPRFWISGYPDPEVIGMGNWCEVLLETNDYSKVLSFIQQLEREKSSILNQIGSVDADIPYWKEMFPDFELDVAIPQGFEDYSWSGNMCPEWANIDLQVTLVIDYKDIEMSDIRESDEQGRFMIHSYPESIFMEDGIWDYSGSRCELLLETNNYDEVVAFVDKLERECLWKQSFPNFELDFVVPQGFEDVSNENDALPSWMNKDLKVVLWADFKDLEQSEARFCHEDPRFAIISYPDSILELDGSWDYRNNIAATLMATNNYDEIIEFVKKLEREQAIVRNEDLVELPISQKEVQSPANIALEAELRDKMIIDAFNPEPKPVRTNSLADEYAGYIRDFKKDECIDVTPVVDVKVAKALLGQGYDKGEVSQMLAEKSICAGNRSDTAREYGKSVVKEAARNMKIDKVNGNER